MFQMFDEGRLIDVVGNEVDFWYVVIVMILNFGVSQNVMMGFGEDVLVYLYDQMCVVQDFFVLEIFNCIDSVVCFGLLNM